MRFLHTADLHLGKPFGNFDEDTRGALKAARLNALRRIGEVASERGAECILIAGDTFDAEAPPSRLVKRAMDSMAAFPNIVWIWMPGNHDSLAAVDLWERIELDKPDNVVLATSNEVIEFGDEVAVLPSPPTVRTPGYDLTEWMTTQDTGNRIRIGLAHGGVTDFGSEDGGLSTIPPDRAERSRLEYLALGDWHRQMPIGRNTWYAGAPEADTFKGEGVGGALLVDIAGPGEAPMVEQVPIGQFSWCRIEAEFFAGNDPVSVLENVLPNADRENTLLRFSGTGRLGLSELADLKAACGKVSDDFHFFSADFENIRIEQNIDDLDLIAEGGALRAAAESILAETTTEGRTEEDARIAQKALSHLFHLAQEVTN